MKNVIDGAFFKKQWNKQLQNFYGITKDSDKTSLDNVKRSMHSKVTDLGTLMDPSTNGYYYVYMTHGTWVNQLKDLIETNKLQDVYGEFSSLNNETFDYLSRNFAMHATDIDIPQLNIEYDTLSGRVRNINYASKVHFAGDFSINYVDTSRYNIFGYHEAWFKYIEACKKGYLTKKTLPKDYTTYKGNHSDYFIDVPYFNAVWVAVFDPFSTNIRGLIKILGASPINLPFKQIIGDRGKNNLTVINMNYKSNDIVYKFFDNEPETVEKSVLYKEFVKDINPILDK